MLEIPQKIFETPPPIPVPTARPTGIDNSGIAPRGEHMGLPPAPPSQPIATDKVAVASSICGFTAFIPIFSQLLGLALGVWALFRIRRARTSGVRVHGRGWAMAGIAGNGVVLLGWLALFGIFASLKTTLDKTTKELHPLLKKTPAHHRQFRE